VRKHKTAMDDRPVAIDRLPEQDCCTPLGMEVRLA
jgi:hypothetical protein